MKLLDSFLKSRIRNSFAAVLAAFGGVAAASAQTGTWQVDASGVWSTPGNWFSGTVADGSGNTANFGQVDVTGDLTVSLDSARTIGNLIFGDTNTATAGSWTLDNGGNALNTLTLSPASPFPTITVNALGAGKVATISAQILGTGGFQKAGAGTLVVTGQNTYSGATRINAGTLRASDGTNYAGNATVTAGGLASGSIITFANNTVLQLRANGDNTGSAQNLFFNNNLQVNASVTNYTIDVDRQGGTSTNKTLRLGTASIGSGSGLNTQFNFTGSNGYNVSIGNIQIGGGGLNGGVAFNPTTTSVTLAAVSSSADNTFKTLELSGTSAGNTVAGAISNGGGTNRVMHVVKSGVSSWTLSAANTYSGSTTISAGTLVLSGVGTLGTGNVTLAASGTLDISGLTASSYTLGSSQVFNGDGVVNAVGKTLVVNGTFNPGSSPGDLDVTGSFTLGGTSISNFEINGTTPSFYDSLQVTGLLTLGGTLNLSTGYAFQVGDFVDLFDWGTISGSFSSITGTSLGGGLSWDTSQLYTTGVITVVPEPGTMAMLALGGTIVLAFRKRSKAPL